MSGPPIPPDAGFSLAVRAPVATITLSRPDRRNCQFPTMWAGLARARRDLPGDVRVVVLRAEGPSFSAGLDRALFSAPNAGVLQMAQLSYADATAHIADWQQAFEWDARADLVSVAAVQGHAVGAGFQLALSADIRILADDAQLTMAEPSLGLVPDLGGTKRLVDLVGYSLAVDICLTGRRIGAEEALRLRLASQVVSRDGLDDAVDTTVRRLLAVDRDAAAETKALLRAAAGRTQQQQQAAERDAQYRRLRALAGLEGED